MASAIDKLFGVPGRVAAVTGAASGIGRACAELLSSAGATVALIDRDEDAATATLKAITERGGKGLACRADVANEGEVEAACDLIVQQLGRIDVLVNCAGMAIRRGATELPLEEWDRVVAVNMTGSFLFSRAAARHMIRQQSGGAIVQTASIMGLSGGGLYPNISYQTTKGAIVNMTRALAVEWAPHRIRVNAVAPTYVRTPFIAALLEQPTLMARIEQLTPLARIAEPQEVAAAVLYLASPAAAMVTGHTLPVDGGYLAQ